MHQRKGNKEKEKNKSTARVPRAVSAPRFDARAHLRSLGVDEAIAADWLTLRTRKRAPPTATAIAGIAREAAKAGLSLADALRLCCERGWQALRADWLDGASGNAQAPRSAARSRGVPLEALDGQALDAMARELGIATSRPGESAQAFIGRIQAARNRLH